MSITTNSIPNATIEAIARSLFRETAQYGFKQVDYLRFVNILLDMSMKNGYQTVETQNISTQYSSIEAISLPLIGELVTIRRFSEKQDISYLLKWLDGNNGRYFLVCRMTGERSDANSLFYSDRIKAGVITLNNNVELPIGILAFFDYDSEQGKAELRELIGVSKYKSRELLKEATKLWIQYGISNLGLKKIYLNALDTNIRNIKLNEELGFKAEGILRNECCIDGKYHDVLKMGYIIE